jgi:hypothetical protein
MGLLNVGPADLLSQMGNGAFLALAIQLFQSTKLATEGQKRSEIKVSASRLAF